MIKSKLTPRQYQQEILQRAQEGNVIAALATGSGKTFISALLIQWIHARESSKGKAIIFFTPTQDLAKQQGEYLTKHTGLRVITLYGVKLGDVSDGEVWKKRFSEFDVFVMTPQIFYNLLTHGRWSMDKVSLLIFDECHHCKKSHPYARIMREYTMVCVEERPKVFGMTASPIWNTQDPQGSLKDLETNLDAVVISVHKHAEELQAYSHKPVEIIKTYPPPSSYPDYPSPSLWDCLNMYYPWESWDIPWDKIAARYTVTKNDLGPYAAEMFLYHEIEARLQRLVNGASHSATVNYDCLTPIMDILKDFESMISSRNERPTSFSHCTSIIAGWSSPKLAALVDVLIEYAKPGFQGIIFVQQRQIAACLAEILPSFPSLSGKIKCAELVGQGGSAGESTYVASERTNAAQLFRERSINLLVATSVAEEGLDFPACDIVVRFDALQNLVGYVQSRGRARNKASTFVIMVQQDDPLQHLEKYTHLSIGEQNLRDAYQHRGPPEIEHKTENEEEDPNTDDLHERERFVIASTGAVLTYDNSISLLHLLCALIPCDRFTAPYMPKFEGDFQSTLYLPPALPLSLEHLVYTGPFKRTKKEAKRAVAFTAVKVLFHLDVFDTHLHPVTGSRGKNGTDADGRSIPDVSHILATMDVSVWDPWTCDRDLWLHEIWVADRCIGGLVTGSRFVGCDFLSQDSVQVQISSGQPLLHQDEEREREMIQEFTTLGIRHFLTSRPLSGTCSVCVVPLNAERQLDTEAMGQLLRNPFGSNEWLGSGEFRIAINIHEQGRTFKLRQIRHDLNLGSRPPEHAYQTYGDYFKAKWTRKGKVPEILDGPLLELERLRRSLSGQYPLRNSAKVVSRLVAVSQEIELKPMSSCRWLALSEDTHLAYILLPQICSRLTDRFRAGQARLELGLPLIDEDLLVEALTLPCVNARHSNQRLETVGDAVLELCNSVHIFNKYPNRHEGQLSHLRQGCICNRTLRARALEIHLEQFLTCESRDAQSWRYLTSDSGNRRLVNRNIPRRSLQDSMEAILGAAYVTGGVDMALQAGEALGLSLGGRTPWHFRSYSSAGGPLAPMELSSRLDDLQDRLGYKFQRLGLLVEALTHPSYAALSLGPSFQRLEFLGDALLDLAVIHHNYNKFPDANSHQLAWPRTRVVCATSLAYLAVTRLGLHEIVLIDNNELQQAIDEYVPLLETLAGSDVVFSGWKLEPPKVLSDIFESVMGALLVDSGYNHQLAASVVEYVMEDVLKHLSPSMIMDPVSELLRWVSTSNCKEVKLVKAATRPDIGRKDGFTVLVHGLSITGIIAAPSVMVAKMLASERALTIMRDSNHEHYLARLCDCVTTMVAGEHDNGPGSSEEEDAQMMAMGEQTLGDCSCREEPCATATVSRRDDNLEVGWDTDSEENADDDDVL